MKNMQIIVILIVVVIAVVVVLGFFGVGGLNFFSAAQPQQPATTDTGSTAPAAAQQLLAQVQQQGSVTQLTAADITEGTGTPIAAGDTIDVVYTGALPNGTIFDSTQAHGGTPLTLVVGKDGSLTLPSGGGLIQGWSLGMAGMKEGGRRLLAIPPNLGYGATGQGPIPANATLLFDVQVVKVTHAGASAATTPAPAQ